jgi:hypothetical protein
MQTLSHTSVGANPKTRTKHLLDLPNELLLDVLNNLRILPRQRRTDLIPMVLVCRRFRPLATETLLLQLVVHTYNTHLLVHTYLQYPAITARVYSIELLTHGPWISKRKATLAPNLWIYTLLNLDDQFKTACTTIIY